MTPLSIKRIKIQSLALVLVLAGAIDIIGATGDVDPTFNPVFTSTLTGQYTGEAALQPDGKWILYGGSPRFIQRVNPDGSLDPTFDCPACTSFPLGKVAVQADGKILVSTSNKIIRVFADGSLDTSFRTHFDVGVDPSTPQLLFPLADGKIVVKFRVTLTLSGVSYDLVRRLNNDGTFDTTFSSIAFSASPRPYITQMVLQADGKIFMGGGNSTVVGGWLKRYHSDGTLDSSFTATASSTVEGLGQLPDGRYIVTGTFSTINGVSRIGYARLFADGSVDMSMSIPPGPNDWPRTVRTLPNGQFYVWTFKNFIPNPSPARFVRYNADGGVDNTFTQTVLNQNYFWEVDAEGRVFTFRNGPPSRYTRLNLNGTIDASFNPEIILKGSVTAVTLQADGKVVLAGIFEKVNGVSTVPFVRLNPNGSIDSTFNVGTGFNLPPDKLVMQPDGKILASGLFAGYNGTWRSNLARINSDGSVDLSFNATIDGRVNAAMPLPDGRVVIGGEFNTVNGMPRKGLAVLNSDGSPDMNFSAVFNGFIGVYDITFDPAGGFIATGYFNGVNGHNTAGAVRFRADNNVDTGFTSGTNRINAIAVRSDGKYIVVTRNHGGNDTSEVLRLNSNGSRDWVFLPKGACCFGSPPDVLIQPSGNVLYSAPASQGYIERIGPNGEEDIFFPTFGANGNVRTLLQQPDGKIIVAGSFSGIEDVPRSGIAKLTLSNRIRATLFDYDGDGRSDVSVFRPSTNTWYEILSGTGSVGVQTFGTSGDLIVPADYDGDGKTDIGVFRPSTGDWIYIASETNTVVTRNWGLAGDVPLPSDVDADGTSEIIVYRPSNGQWFWNGSSGSTSIFFGIAGDLPVSGDFDGDGRTDRAIFRPSTGDWWWAASSENYTPRAGHWGQSGDIPVPADYDGDSRTDLAIFRPSDGGWYIYNSSNGSYTALQFGTAGDRPAPGDYDGDGRTDLGIFRPSTGVWYLWQSTSGFAGLQFGLTGDVPTPGAFLP